MGRWKSARYSHFVSYFLKSQSYQFSDQSFLSLVTFSNEAYADFLENELPALFENIPLRERGEFIFKHDGSHPHFSRQVRDVLDTRYSDKWMDRGPIIWPARSPNLNVLDYFIWSHIKDLVEHIHNSTKAEARKAILVAFNTITEMAHHVTRNITRRAEICLRERGRHFKQFLH